MIIATQEEYDRLSYNTLSHAGEDFIHQHVVGTIGARQPSPNDTQQRGEITVSSVLAVPEVDRDSMIHQWCRSVWEAYAAEHDRIKGLIGQLRAFSGTHTR